MVYGGSERVMIARHKTMEGGAEGEGEEGSRGRMRKGP